VVARDRHAELPHDGERHIDVWVRDELTIHRDRDIALRVRSHVQQRGKKLAAARPGYVRRTPVQGRANNGYRRATVRSQTADPSAQLPERVDQILNRALT